MALAFIKEKLVVHFSGYENFGFHIGFFIPIFAVFSGDSFPGSFRCSAPFLIATSYVVYGVRGHVNDE